jgi:hypothetical protein
MARIRKTQDKDNHILEIIGDRDEGRLFLVRGGKRAYLWAGEASLVTVSGVVTLRKLAQAILAEVGKEA